MDRIGFFPILLILSSCIMFASCDDGGSKNISIYFTKNDFTGSIKVGPIEFTENIDFMSMTYLTNGNFLIAYRDPDDGNKGKFDIFTAEGNKVGVTVEFSSIAACISTATLLNDNIVIAYETPGSSQFVIYTQEGVKVGSTITFSTGHECISTSVLRNGNLILASGTNFGVLNLYSPTGTKIGSTVTFTSNHLLYPTLSSTALPNGCFLLSYSDADDLYRGKTVIYNSDGTEAVGTFVFNDPVLGHTGPTSSIGFFNGNYMVAYRDNGPLKIVVYDSLGNLVRPPEIFSDANCSDIISKQIMKGNNYGDVIIGYTDSSSNSTGNFFVYDIPTGKTVLKNTIFDSYVGDVAMTSLMDGNVAIAYSAWKNSIQKGCFIILE